MPASADRRQSKAADGAEPFDWQPVIGRCLAILCMQATDMAERPLLDRAEYLMGLGLPRREAAAALGSTDESIRVGIAKRAKRDSGAKTASKADT